MKHNPHTNATRLTTNATNATHLAPIITTALRAADTAADLAAWPERNSDGGPAPINTISDPTGTAATNMAAIRRHGDAIRTILTRIGDHITHIERDLAALSALAHGTPTTRPTMCADTQHTIDTATEWGDPHCPMPATKRGLCQKHYDAHRYHTRNHHQ